MGSNDHKYEYLIITIIRTGSASVSIGYVYPETFSSSIMDVKVKQIFLFRPKIIL